MAEKNKKKNIPLRLSTSLYEEILRWAEDDFRSINGQIEFLLTECVNKRKKNKAKDKKTENTEIAELEKQLAVTQIALMSRIHADEFVDVMTQANYNYENDIPTDFLKNDTDDTPDNGSEK